MWLNKLKIAIIEKNTNSLDALLQNVPQLESRKEIEEAVYLLKEATDMVETLKQNTSDSMKQIRKNLDFLRSMDTPVSKRFDIRS